jgi:hypothetical protein
MGKAELDVAQIGEAVALWLDRHMRGARIRGPVRFACPGIDPPPGDEEEHGIEVEVEYPPIEWCGMRSHDWDCRCGGTGGDR